MALLLTYTLAALAISFLCSLLEAVLLSVPQSYVVHLEESGSPAGQALARHKSDIHKPIVAILTLNTVAHTAGAALAGAQAQAIWGSRALAIISAVLTLLILVFSEIIPKTLGAAHCTRLAPWTARTLSLLVWVFKPFIVLSGMLTMGAGKDEEETKIDRGQIASMARLGASQGTLEAAEATVITNIVAMANVRVHDLMTPRTVVFSLAESSTIEDAMNQRFFARFSRIPVWQSKEDDVRGYVLKDELLTRAAKGHPETRLSEHMRPLWVLPESQLAVDAFRQMIERKEHIALVVDEYGGFAGIVTLEDVLETLLGYEIVDEADAVRDMRVLARRRWEERAKRLGIAPMEHHKEGDWHRSSHPPFSGSMAPLGSIDGQSVPSAVETSGREATGREDEGAVRTLALSDHAERSRTGNQS